MGALGPGLGKNGFGVKGDRVWGKVGGLVGGKGRMWVRMGEGIGFARISRGGLGAPFTSWL